MQAVITTFLIILFRILSQFFVPLYSVSTSFKALAIVFGPPHAIRYNVLSSLSNNAFLIKLEPSVALSISPSYPIFPILVILFKYFGVGYVLSCFLRFG